MTFYKSIPVAVEAYRFDGSVVSGKHILEWAVKHGVKNPWIYPDDSNHAPQLDLRIPHVKIAEIGDYIVRGLNETIEPRSRFRVMTEDQFKATYDYSKGF